MLDFTIETSEVLSTHTRTSTFIFNASDSQWEHQKHIINRPFSRLQYCRSLDLKNGEITYYSAAFNLENGTVLQNETTATSETSSFNVDESTFQCLGPNNVYEQYVVRNVRVLRCFSDENYYCTRQSPARKDWPYGLDLGDYVVSPLVFDRESFNDSLVQYLNQSRVRSVWDDLDSPNLVCVKKQLPTKTIPGHANRTFIPNYPNQQTDCLLTARTAKNDTLLEHWRYDPKNYSLERFYSGALLEGELEIGKSVCISILWHLTRKANWAELSTLLLSYSLVYEPRQYNFTRIGEVEYTVSVIPDYALPLVATLVVVAIGIQFLICFTIGKDKRPRFNTINGVSSILREEQEPTGRSLTRGNTATIAWYFTYGRGPRFGPRCGSGDTLINPKDRTHFPQEP